MKRNTRLGRGCGGIELVGVEWENKVEEEKGGEARAFITEKHGAGGRLLTLLLLPKLCHAASLPAGKLPTLVLIGYISHAVQHSATALLQCCRNRLRLFYATG